MTTCLDRPHHEYDPPCPICDVHTPRHASIPEALASLVPPPDPSERIAELSKHIKALVMIIRKNGGYSTSEQQEAVRSAAMAIGAWP
jgi:hypothetical protein